MTDRPESDERPDVKGDVNEEFHLLNHELLQPLEGKLVDVTLKSGDVVKARVVSVYRYSSKLKIVPNSTKE